MPSCVQTDTIGTSIKGRKQSAAIPNGRHCNRRGMRRADVVGIDNCGIESLVLWGLLTVSTLGKLGF